MAEAPDPSDLLALSEPIRERTVVRHHAREASIQASREATRAAANAIRAIHRREDDRAAELVAASRAALDEAVGALASYPDLLHAGFVHDAAKEYAEAVLTHAAVTGADLPGPEAVDVDDTAWLHGLAESVGECRRACLDRMRGGRLDEAERLLALMQEILSVLAGIDAPDGVTKGLRRASDVARAITERTRGDLTAAAGQRRLRDALEAHRAAVERLLARDGDGSAGPA